MKKRFMVILVLFMAASMVFAGGSQETADTSDEKIEMTIMTEIVNIPAMTPVTERLIAEYPDVDFARKQFSATDAAQIIKTAFAGGEAIDLTIYWPNQIGTFVEAGMVLDLTPYLDADPAWKDRWLDGALEIGTYNDKIYGVPSDSVYPMFLANKSIFAEAGLEVKDSYTWDEFEAVLAQLDANTEAFPLSVNMQWGTWLVRNGLIQIWDDEEELRSFIAGDVSFLDPRVKEMFENVKGLYDNNYLYPGESALVATRDQTLAAFVQGKAALLATVNSLAQGDSKAVGDAFDVAVVSWPSMNDDMDYTLGGASGWFIPSNTKHPDLAVDMLKYITSEESVQIMVDGGLIAPFKNAVSSDPNFKMYGKYSYKVFGKEIINTSAELFDYINGQCPANYLLYGDQALEDLEALRLDIE
ncbi:MAG: extracellular solute-binding protein [Spirochaetia bacterium]|nr:extracellular solute-binding protein [Spirochaetia bacterium]